MLPTECGGIYSQLALEGAPERISVAEADSRGYALDATVREQQLATGLVYPKRLHVARRSGPKGFFENPAKVPRTEANPLGEDFDREIIIQMGGDPGWKFGKAIVRPTIELGEIECIRVFSKRPEAHTKFASDREGNPSAIVFLNQGQGQLRRGSSTPARIKPSILQK
jgi:hypothetical protein